MEVASLAVRFKRVGANSSGGVSDHNDLLNKGTRTHAEIDAYLEEIDAARGDFPDLDARIESQKGNTIDPQELIDARTDRYGTTFPNLKSRLDDMDDRIAAGGSGGGGGGAAAVIEQMDLPSVKAPYETMITSNQGSYRMMPPEVIRFVPGPQGVVTEQYSFTYSTGFEADDQVEFDGVMQLVTVYQTNLANDGILGEGRTYSAPLNRAAYKLIEKIEVI